MSLVVAVVFLAATIVRLVHLVVFAAGREVVFEEGDILFGGEDLLHAGEECPAVGSLLSLHLLALLGSEFFAALFAIFFAILFGCP